MTDRNTNWIPPLVLSIYALVGITAALRGNLVLSGISALFFAGYFVIRMPNLLGLPSWRIPERARLAGFIFVLAGFVVILLYAVFHLQR